MKDTSVIPKGIYCYGVQDGKRVRCPYWSLRDDQPEQHNGYCSFLERGDWEVKIPPDFPPHFPTSCLSLLWDAVKECGINEDYDEDEPE